VPWAEYADEQVSAVGALQDRGVERMPRRLDMRRGAAATLDAQQQATTHERPRQQGTRASGSGHWRSLQIRERLFTFVTTCYVENGSLAADRATRAAIVGAQRVHEQRAPVNPQTRASIRMWVVTRRTEPSAASCRVIGTATTVRGKDS
jgi:hypothetical protein